MVGWFFGRLRIHEGYHLAYLFFFALFLSHRRVLVRLGDGEVWMRGVAQKNQEVFRKEFGDLVAELKRLAGIDAGEAGEGGTG